MKHQGGRQAPCVVLKARRQTCANSRWKVFLDHISDTQGLEVPDYLVVETLTRNTEGYTGVCVLPVLRGQFLLQKAYRHAMEQVYWEAPRGFIDAKEPAERAALRELLEETGLACAPEDLRAVGEYCPEPSTLRARVALFVASGCYKARRPEKDELGLGEVRLFDAYSVRRMMAQGEIGDPGTQLAFLHYVAQAR